MSGAVSGIESRLDSILAEENALAAQQAADATKTNGATSAGNTVSRTPSARRTRPATGPVRSQTPQPVSSKLAAPRPSTESTVSDSAVDASKPGPRVSEEPATRSSNDLYDTSASTSTEHAKASLDTPRPSADDAPTVNGFTEEPPRPVKSAEELLSELQQARADHENVELRRQEEVHDYLERIDALQAKLQYLTKEVSEAARKAATELGQDHVNKKLAEKDEKIALLLEEGTKLSKSEVTQLGTIRNLRAEKAEQANSLADARRKLGLQESVIKDRAYEVSRLEVERREALTRASTVPTLENEVASLKATLSRKDERIRTLEADVKDANTRADDETRQRNAEALDVERATSSSLRDEVLKLKNDLASAAEQATADSARVQEKERVIQERHQAAEAAFRNEVSTLEGRLEILRSKTEENTTSSTSDSTTKLMRQIEVLQRQYAVASENWQGIEASMQSRMTALEMERDDSAKHEHEARKKTREVGSSTRKLQDQLDEANQRIRMFEHEVAEHKANAESIQKRADDFEKIMHEARDKFEREKRDLNVSLSKMEEERSKWQSQMQSVEPSIFSGSPHPSHPRRTPTLDLPGLSTRRQAQRSTSNLTLSSIHRDSHSRRNSALPPTRGSDNVTSPIYDSGPPTPFFGNAGNVPATPSVPTVATDHDADDDFDNVSSPRRTINDMLSASTAAAGPSVQLVERMSASVRRLETEKAAHKEEMSRLSGQRDEARKEIVSLMQEVEDKRELDKKVEKIQKDLSDTQRRYTASLEMLGEKEEKVGELQADVTDLKKIYRELVERTVK